MPTEDNSNSKSNTKGRTKGNTRSRRRGFSLVRQRDSMQCGAACLTMVCRHFGADASLDDVDQVLCATNDGVSLLAISRVADSFLILFYFLIEFDMDTDDMRRVRGMTVTKKVEEKTEEGDAGRRRAPEEERSPRIRSLLGERPHWLVRNGTALLFLLFLLLALGCLFFGERFVR